MRIFTDGAEFGDTKFWTSGVAGVATNPTPVAGLYSYYASSNGTFTKEISPLTELYFRERIYESGMTSWIADAQIPDFGETVRLYHNSSTLKFCLINSSSNSVMATGTRAISGGQWLFIECYLKIAANPDGRFILYVNGLLEIDYVGQTNMNGASVSNIHYYHQGSQTYVDDLALNDTSNSDGKNDNSWCGDGYVELLKPNNNGDVNSWVGSDGNSTDNYLLVDDIPATGDDYVKASTDVQDMYNLTDFTATGKIVTRIWAECRAKDQDMTAGAIWLGFKTGGNTYMSSAVRPLSGLYTRIVGDEAKVDPSDSGVWSDSDLDSIQFVVEASSSSSTSSSSSSSIP